MSRTLPLAALAAIVATVAALDSCGSAPPPPVETTCTASAGWRCPAVVHVGPK